MLSQKRGNLSNYALSIIIPTLNEEGNIDLLVNEIMNQKNANEWEIIFVDDNSNDRTLAKIKKNSNRFNNIKYIDRKKNRSLSLSCVEGFKKANSEYILVMDADLQHHPKYINILFEKIKSERLDIVVASRFLSNDSQINFSFIRKKISLIAVYLANIFIDIKLTDPLSGFFVISKEYLSHVIKNLDNKGFKILLEIIIKSSKKPKMNEQPIDFNSRVSGKSKLSLSVILDFLRILLLKYIR